MLVGDRDILKGPGYSRMIQSHIQGSAMKTIPGAGHAVVIENPTAVAAEVNEFLTAT